MTIIEAIKSVMRSHVAPMTAREAFRAIVQEGLYKFHAQNPEHVVRMQIRRHSVGIHFPSASRTKHFKFVPPDKYEALARPRAHRHQARARLTGDGRTPTAQLAASLGDLQTRCAAYLESLRGLMLSEIRKLPPTSFERFSKELLAVYGFEDLHVTRQSGDGGIDGFGKLRVGLAHLNVAFQCKRWTKGNVQRVDIDKFRGVIQGDFEQGIFFATTSFSAGAIGASIKRGAVPVVLVDGPAIVDLMIEKRLGVQVETLLIPVYALDLALDREPSQIFVSAGRAQVREEERD
ncbi:MAG: restriction endonuclease [Dehalococcoidia bacterium]